LKSARVPHKSNTAKDRVIINLNMAASHPDVVSFKDKSRKEVINRRINVEGRGPDRGRGRKYSGSAGFPACAQPGKAVLPLRKNYG
jgi:hypothetical protein